MPNQGKAGVIQKDLENARKDIKTDHYQMSIGELINLYKDGDIILTPAYQRLFRWKEEKKTKLIESLLLGIPIPPIFVAQNEAGIWEVVDGVQRISTILQLTGDLKEHEPLKLTTCKYMPSLKGETWGTLPQELCRIIKRSRLTINIILTENNIWSQYELFQRLNTGGVHLSSQEIRNCLIIMADPVFHKKLEEFNKNSMFLKNIKISEEKEMQEYGTELLLRYLITKNNEINFKDYKSSSHMQKFIDTETLKLVEKKDFDLDSELNHLEEVSKYIGNIFGGDCFKSFNSENKKYSGGFNISMFESILPGLSKNFEKHKHLDREGFENILHSMLESEDFKKAKKHGTKPIRRTELLTKLSFDTFDSKKI